MNNNEKPSKTIRISIDGAAIDDIPSLYKELNRAFMTGEDWTLGESLDALDDVLYGGYGTLKNYDRAVIEWENHEHSRTALGLEATRNFYQRKLSQPDIYDIKVIREQLGSLESGLGKTYFEIVQEIFSEHSDITVKWL